MSTASTAKTANSNGTQKQAKAAAKLESMQLIAEITKNAINQNFPLLNTAPDIMYVTMAIWGLESGWNLWHRKRSGEYDSAHLSPVDPFKSTLIGKGYYKVDPILSFRNRPNITPEEIKNIAEGFVAHGLSACMGCYHVRGTPNYKQAFGPYEAKVVNPLGLAVNPGESITAIFPNNELGMTRSINAGLIILEGKYKIGLRKYNNPSRAIEAAVGYYVGTAGARDVNGYSPEDRQRDIMYSPSGRLSTLAQIGITKTGKIGAEYTPDMAALARARDNTPPPNSVSSGASQVRVATNTAGSTPIKPVGCAT